MALHPEPVEPPDPVDDEVARVLADPDVRAQLDEIDTEIEAGNDMTDVVSHDEVRRRLGLAPTDTNA